MKGKDSLGGAVFLRGINITGTRIQGNVIERLFNEAGVRQASPFLASGNVIVSNWDITIQHEIEDKFLREIGTSVPVFFRTRADLSTILEASNHAIDASKKSFVLFRRERTATTPLSSVSAFLSDKERMVEVEGDLVWITDSVERSRFSNSVLEKIERQPSTLRSLNTLSRVIAKMTKTVATPADSLG